MGGEQHDLDSISKEIKKIIKTHEIHNWLKDYPWLKGYIGDRNYPVWFVAENPSLRGVKRVHDRRSLNGLDRRAFSGMG